MAGLIIFAVSKWLHYTHVQLNQWLKIKMYNFLQLKLKEQLSQRISPTLNLENSISTTIKPAALVHAWKAHTFNDQGMGTSKHLLWLLGDLVSDVSVVYHFIMQSINATCPATYIYHTQWDNSQPWSCDRQLLFLTGVQLMSHHPPTCNSMLHKSDCFSIAPGKIMCRFDSSVKIKCSLVLMPTTSFLATISSHS